MKFMRIREMYHVGSVLYFVANATMNSLTHKKLTFTTVQERNLSLLYFSKSFLKIHLCNIMKKSWTANKQGQKSVTVKVQKTHPQRRSTFFCSINLPGQVISNAAGVGKNVLATESKTNCLHTTKGSPNQPLIQHNRMLPCPFFNQFINI